MQIHYFARHFRVLTMDGLGNGRSDRCRDPRRYGAAEFARDCIAVMERAAPEKAVVVSLSRGAQYTLELARLAPERVLGAAFIGPLFPYTHRTGRFLAQPALPLPRLSAALLRLSLVGAYERGPLAPGLPEVREVVHLARFPEPHSTKGIEDGVGWALDTDPETH